MQSPSRLKFSVETEVSTSVRAQQVSSMFDAPPQEKCRLEWDIDVSELGRSPWQVGLIVGPSGSGKSTVMKELWGEPPEFEWTGLGVVDDFDQRFSTEDIAKVCQAVGFNTIPAWMRPFAVLSNGEKFRVDLARRLLEGNGEQPIVVDEFTSVVDRQVAKIGSHAVQKFIRRSKHQFVAVGCHYDVIDWLQPDWVLDMATRQMTRRLLQQRPGIDISIGRIPRAAWRVFSPFHYLTADLHRGATCYGLWANGCLAAFAGVLHKPHPKVDDIKGVSRLVTLPDWQGCGLAMCLVDKLGAAYKTQGWRLRTYPAHPSLVRAFDKSKCWSLKKRPGDHSPLNGKTSTLGGRIGGRPCAVFEYHDEALPVELAEQIGVM